MAVQPKVSDLSSLEEHQTAIENWVANLNQKLGDSRTKLTSFEETTSNVTTQDLESIQGSLDSAANGIHTVCLFLQDTDNSILAIRDASLMKVVVLRMRGGWKNALAHTADRLQILSSHVQCILAALESTCQHADALLQHTKEFVREGSDFKAKSIAPLRQAIEVVNKTMQKVEMEGEALLLRTEQEHETVSSILNAKKTALTAVQEAVRQQQLKLDAQKRKVKAMEARCREIQSNAKSCRTKSKILGGATVLGVVGAVGAIIATGGLAAPAVLGVASVGTGVASAVKSEDADRLFENLKSMRGECEKLEAGNTSIRKELDDAKKAMDHAQSEYDTQYDKVEAVNATIRGIKSQKRKHQSTVVEASNVSRRCNTLNSKASALQKSMQQLKSEASSCVLALREYLTEASSTMDVDYATIEPMAFSRRKHSLLDNVTSVLKLFEENRPLLNGMIESTAIHKAIEGTKHSDVEVMQYLNRPKLIKAREKMVRRHQRNSQGAGGFQRIL